jgi:hypothetical protein
MKCIFGDVTFICCLAVLSILITSCEKEVIVDDNFNASENYNRTIKFDVYNLYSVSPILDSTVRDVTIDIFGTYYELIYDYYPDATRITDSLGQAEINGLEKDYYYIRASHPVLGNIIDSVSTPANTISFVELYY